MMKKLLTTGALIAATIIPTFGSAEIYKAKCIACHQAGGLGIPMAFPPLAESEWVNGPVENLIRIQLRGLIGEITVKGVKYNSMMPANKEMNDEDIASILTYVRSNFGNKSGAVTAAEVKVIRAKEAGNATPLTVKDLIDPAKAAKEATPEKKDEEKK